MEHTTITSDDSRVAVGHANYPGDVTAGIAADIASGFPHGPNYMGELMWPVDATYSPDQDKTRVGFSFLRPTGGDR